MAIERNNLVRLSVGQWDTRLRGSLGLDGRVNRDVSFKVADWLAMVGFTFALPLQGEQLLLKVAGFRVRNDWAAELSWGRN